MNIDDTRLTDDEIKQCGQALVTSNLSRMVPGFAEAVARRVADAQLAKALWGVVDWLKSHEMELITGYHLVFAGDRITWELEQAGIPKPGGEQ